MSPAGATSLSDPPLAPPAALWRHPCVVGALALVLLRAVYLAFPNLLPEEAYYWNYGQHLALGYLDHPPLVAWLIRLGGAIFGHGELGVRVFALVCSLLTSFFAFRLTDLLYGRRAAVVALLLVQLLPFFFVMGWIMTPDAPLTACWAAVLYFLARVFFAGSDRAWLGVGICLGIGMLSKYTIALLGPATLLFLMLDPRSRIWFRRLWPYGAVALALVIFSPVIIWNARNHWASFAFQSTGRMNETEHFALHHLFGALALLLTPLGLFLAGQPLFSRGGFPATPAGDPQTARRYALFVRLFTLVPLSVFTLFSLTHLVKLNWTGPLSLAIVPLISARLASAFDGAPAPIPGAARHLAFLRWSALLTGAFLAVSYAGVMQYLAFGLPGVGYSRSMELLPVGWREMARALDEQAAVLRRADTERVLVVGLDRDFIASEAAFYAADPARASRETTGVHLFGGISLMYAYWFPAAEQNGATLLLVSFDPNDLGKPRVSAHCLVVGPIQTAWLSVHGKLVRPYYTRVGYQYQDRPYASLSSAQ